MNKCYDPYIEPSGPLCVLQTGGACSRNQIQGGASRALPLWEAVAQAVPALAVEAAALVGLAGRGSRRGSASARFKTDSALR